MSVTNISTPHVDSQLTYGRPVSDVYQDYVAPLVVEWADMNPRPSYDKLNEILRTPWMVWNAVVYSDYYPEADDLRMIEWMRSLVKESNSMGRLVEWWIKRKRTEFGKYRYLFGACAFYENEEGESRCRAAIFLPDNVTVKYGTYGERSPFTQS